MSDTKSCKTCRYFKSFTFLGVPARFDGVRKNGECRLNPPSPRPTRHIQGFGTYYCPLVEHSDYCGRWEIWTDEQRELVTDLGGVRDKA